MAKNKHIAEGFSYKTLKEFIRKFNKNFKTTKLKTKVLGEKMEIRIEVYDLEVDTWASKKYFVSGYNDVLWIDNIEDLIKFIIKEIDEYEKVSM